MRGGFSLVELLAVVVILGLIGGVAVVSWRMMLPNQQLNTAVRALSEVLHGTRSEAIAQSREFQIWYYLDEERYVVRTPYKPGGGRQVRNERPEDLDYVWIHDTSLAPDGLEIASVTVDDEAYYDGVVFVRFDPLGAASNHVIVLYQPQFERYFTIVVHPLTGQIEFIEGEWQEPDPPEEGDFR